MTVSEDTGTADARRNEELVRFRQLFAQTPSFAAVLVGAKHRFLLANPAYRRLVGGREILGRTFAEALPEIVGQSAGTLLDQVFESGEAHVGREVPFVLAPEPGEAAEERRLDFVYQPIRGDDGAVVAIFVEGTDVTERHRANEALRESEARNRQILDSAIDYAIIATGNDGRVTRWNKGAEHILGWSEAEMLGNTIDCIFTPEDRDAGRAAEEVRAALATGHGCDGRWHLRRSGDRFWANGEITPIRDDAGTVTGFVKVLGDRTDEHRAAEALRESEARLRRAQEAGGVGVFTIDLIGDILHASPEFCRIFGLPIADAYPAEVVQRMIVPGDGNASTAETRASGTMPLSTDYTIRRPNDGALRRIARRAEFEYDADGRRVRLLGVVQDVTDQRAAQTQLAELNATLEERVEQRTRERDRAWANSQDLQTVIDPDGYLLEVNQAWATVLGYDPAAVVGRHRLEFAHPDDRQTSVDVVESEIGDGTLPAYENRLRHADGGWRWISWVATREAGLIYGSGRHITAEKEAAAALQAAQDQLRQAQKMEALGQLTGGVAHDFNNLLTVIRGSVDLLRRGTLSPERQARYIDAIADTADRAAKLTAQLLAFARRQTLNPELFDARDSLREVANMVRTLTGSRIAVHIDLPGDPCPIMADRSQFDTAIVNMAINARDAMGGEGVLTIAVAPVLAIPAIRSHPASPGDYIAVTIRDTGHGIAAGVIDRIFEPFFTTKAVGEGTGLGLSQVIGFAKQSGGDVRVESTPGEHAAFSLYLPRAAAVLPKPGDADAIAAAAVADDGTCVLVVEDNEQVGEFACAALEELGYDSILAPDGASALAELARSHGRFHIVFSDVMMPGMTGVELADAIRRRYPGLPVLLTSGYSDVLARGGAHGFELLHKPYSVDQLAQALRRASG